MPLLGLLQAMTTEEFLNQLASHESQIMGFLWSVSPSSDVAEDLFQQAVISMWEKLDQFEAGSNFVAWGCQIAKLKALAFARTRKRLLFDNDIIAKLADEHASEDTELRLMRRQALAGCLAKLKEDDRMLVEKCYLGDRAIRQVAEEVGRSAKGVYSSLARIRKTLFRCVQATLAQEVD